MSFFLILTQAYVFIGFLERGWEIERLMWKRNWFLPYAPKLRNPQHRYVPWPGIEPSTFCCMGRRSNELSHPARATCLFFYGEKFNGFHTVPRGWGPKIYLRPLSQVNFKNKPGLLLLNCLPGSWKGKSKEPELWLNLGKYFLLLLFTHCLWKPAYRLIREGCSLYRQ